MWVVNSILVSKIWDERESPGKLWTSTCKSCKVIWKHGLPRASNIAKKLAKTITLFWHWSHSLSKGISQTWMVDLMVFLKWVTLVAVFFNLVTVLYYTQHVSRKQTKMNHNLKKCITWQEIQVTV